MGEGTVTQAAGRRHIIKRPRLTRLLDETTAGIILLVAPAGYGKTTLAREWLDGKNSSWYQASPASADVAALALGLSDAIARGHVGAQRVVERLSASGAPSTTGAELGDLLIREMAGLADDHVIVIDDHQSIGDHGESYDLIAHLTNSANTRFVITSRVRPRWARARRILYGEVLELGRADLAFTRDEASSVLAEAGGIHSAGLYALSAGWPAVIGLAALTTHPAHTDGDLPEELYEFFAEELYLLTSSSLRSALPFLVVSPRTRRSRLSAFLGVSSGRVLHEAFQLGFIAAESADQLVMHPLLREFLLKKLGNDCPGELDAAAARVLEDLITEGQWDDAFETLKSRPTIPLLEDLIEEAMDDLLHTGRLDTLSRWLKEADAHQLTDRPIVALAQAELAFRQASYVRAELKAVAAAESLPDHHPKRSRAWYRAGQAAYFREDLQRSLEFSKRARMTAISDDDLIQALRGALNAALPLEDDALETYWSLYTALDVRSPDDAVRRAASRLFIACDRGGLIEALREVDEIRALLSDVRDPMIRTGFYNTLVYALCLNGRYEDALAVADAEMVEIEEYRLTFATPLAELERTRALLGLRRFHAAEQSLCRIETTSGTTSNPHVALNLAIGRARLSTQRPSDRDIAGIITDELLAIAPSNTHRAEGLVMRALCALHVGDVESAHRDATQALKTTHAAEASTLAHFVLAAAGLSYDKPEIRIVDALACLKQTGVIDALVWTYRADPRLLAALWAQNPDAVPFLTGVLDRARDTAIASRLGLVLPLARRGSTLSFREREVLALLGRGYSNEAISQKLVISLGTTKVHVRHIFEKLGVRSRTQAALRAVEILNDEEPY